MTSQSESRMKYLIPTEDILILLSTQPHRRVFNTI